MFISNGKKYFTLSFLLDGQETEFKAAAECENSAKRMCYEYFGKRVYQDMTVTEGEWGSNGVVE